LAITTAATVIVTPQVVDLGVLLEDGDLVHQVGLTTSNLSASGHLQYSIAAVAVASEVTVMEG
jgi:hypothetical protein